ncbi:amino acid ABC transporter ATP-binding protein [Ponticoccus alexandrii]|uniref:ATP-binding cassette domain-containing protein n=1 Tax=Ponticoccus alexandrii TaxID=1943633 RepID=A0ABX7F8V4_9RHOB|nr:amino acid ABC transporter ATP-binding protein [Ponticoccus alexandrii]ETA51714.1 amino acid ABC transporter ATP-binding protein [Rhodobacteraceae bacterium PD-2]QRF66566.1 ATP-binding cassette domain-containing protein [Ponticoccus alexandrii]
MSLIDVENLRKSYGETEVLKGIDLAVPQGEVLALIGRSGSGKSTFLRCLNGLEQINSGRVRILGEDLHYSAAGLRKMRQQIGMIFQQFELFPHLTAGRNVMLAQQVVKGIPRDEAEQVAREMLSKVGLAERFDAYPRNLSGGQQQRVAIARALAMSPKALLCDEITSALDPELVQEVLGVVRALATSGMTLIMVTHEMRFAREVCERVAFMHQGRIHEIGAPDELFEAPKTPELKQLLGHLPAAS